MYLYLVKFYSKKYEDFVSALVESNSWKNAETRAREEGASHCDYEFISIEYAGDTADLSAGEIVVLS